MHRTASVGQEKLSDLDEKQYQVYSAREHESNTLTPTRGKKTPRYRGQKARLHFSLPSANNTNQCVYTLGNT